MDPGIGVRRLMHWDGDRIFRQGEEAGGGGR